MSSRTVLAVALVALALGCKSGPKPEELDVATTELARPSAPEAEAESDEVPEGEEPTGTVVVDDDEGQGGAPTLLIDDDEEEAAQDDPDEPGEDDDAAGEDGAAAQLAGPRYQALPIVGSTKGGALRAWAADQAVGVEARTGKFPKEVQQELLEALSPIDDRLRLRWVRVLAPATGERGPTVAVAASYGQEKDADGRTSSALIVGALVDEDGAYVLRSYGTARTEARDKWKTSASEDLDGDGLADLVHHYESSSRGERFDGLIVTMTATGTTSRVAMAEWVAKDHTTDVRWACWTRVDQRPALVMVLEVSWGSREPSRWETDVYVASDAGARLELRPVVATVVAATASYSAARKAWTDKLDGEAPPRAGSVTLPARCSAGEADALVVPSSTVIALTPKLDLEKELVLLAPSLSETATRAAFAERFPEADASRVGLVRFGRDAR